MRTVLDNEKTKNKCQIFTPDEVVKNMLDYLGYKKNLYGKTILESSCGNGQFLKEIVVRYIKDCKTHKMSEAAITKGLSHDIYGCELDPDKYEECINTLNNITNSYKLERVDWQIKKVDALRISYNISFDFAVGNPPYVSYWDLEEEERKFLKENYTVCQKGNFDYSYAFLQDAFINLSSKGKMAYIIPNSIFKTRAGQSLRNLLLPYIDQIYDYTSTEVFDNVLTSPAIIVLTQNSSSPNISYTDLSTNKKINISKKSLENTWIFSDNQSGKIGVNRFGDYFKVATGVATQYNKAFIISNYIEENDYFIVNKQKIEKKLLRIAASPKGKASKKNEWIIFPYYYFKGNLMHYSEQDFKQKFPYAFEYLMTYKENLEKRDADKKALWFEYGRSQALNHLNQNKLLLSTVLTGKVNVYYLEETEVPYSGLFISIKNFQTAFTLQKAQEILTSNHFFDYIQTRGINAKGKSLRITAKDIEDYRW